MRQSIPEQVPRAPDLGRGAPREMLQVARRKGYEDGLVAVGIPYVEALRRATERYP